MSHGGSVILSLGFVEPPEQRDVKHVKRHVKVKGLKASTKLRNNALTLAVTAVAYRVSRSACR